MKLKIFSFSFLATFAFLYAGAQQPTVTEIRKSKIKKVTQQTQGENNPGGKTEWFYNSNGDDTAMYISGRRYYYKTIEYDDRQRKKTVTEFAEDGKQRRKTLYTYNNDGSFSTESKDATYGFRTTEVYNGKGLIVSSKIPDGSVYQYEYNDKGQLLRLYSIPIKGDTKVDVAYTYNTLGKLVRQVNTGDSPYNSIFEYNGDGLLKKNTVIEGNDDGEKETTVYNYSYSY
jgi:YD repeat-containing protein